MITYNIQICMKKHIWNSEIPTHGMRIYLEYPCQQYDWIKYRGRKSDRHKGKMFLIFLDVYGRRRKMY
jgi:hypothetical protein